MAKSTNISPTVALVIERFREAMLADETLEADLADRVVKVLLGDGTVTAPKLTAAMFADSKEYATSEA